MKQSSAFLKGEATAWLERNKNKLPVENDPVLKTIETLHLRAAAVLEIGCADGWRLDALRKEDPLRICHGIDPGAIGYHPFMWKGTADKLDMFYDGEFDTVIYGFCLYLCDREDLFKIVAEGDRVLRDGGHLIIYDFYSRLPYSRVYHHREGIKSFKMNYANLWLANPGYHLVNDYLQPDETTIVSILKKDISNSWPLHD